MCNFNLNCLILAQIVQISKKDGPQKKMQFEWSCSCHRQRTTPCLWVSRQRSYSSPPNNGCFENAIITRTVCAGDAPSAMVAVTPKLNQNDPKGFGCAGHGRHVGASPNLASAYKAPRPYCWKRLTKEHDGNDNAATATSYSAHHHHRNNNVIAIAKGTITI